VVKIEVREAKHLPKMDMVGSCDAFVRIHLGKHTRTTSVINNSYCAQWHEVFELDIGDGDGEEDLHLRLDLFDKDNYFGPAPRSLTEQFIGSAQVCQLIFFETFSMSGI
jgi:hypothetical protein